MKDEKAERKANKKAQKAQQRENRKLKKQLKNAFSQQSSIQAKKDVTEVGGIRQGVSVKKIYWSINIAQIIN